MFNILGYKLKLNLLQLLLILLLSLVLCPLLGGKCGYSEGLENASGNGDDRNSLNPITQTQPLTSIESRRETDIPAGDEDLYILRSEVASLLNKPANTPCPPCGRCPEASFTCKKVPNYNNVHSQNFLPKPVLNDFSTFAQ